MLSERMPRQGRWEIGKSVSFRDTDSFSGFIEFRREFRKGNGFFQLPHEEQTPPRVRQLKESPQREADAAQ
jgi:hypothetical protein